MKAVILDTETTGRKASTMIEVAHLVLPEQFDWRIQVQDEYNERFNPGVAIEMGAMATHHILDEDLVDCRPVAEYAAPKVEYMIGHNTDFDWEVIGKPDVKRICTLALARWLWPKPVVDSHTQSALFYWLNEDDRRTARNVLRNAHSALADVYICHRILRGIIDELASKDEMPDSYEGLWRLSEVARVPTIMPFGKHKDEPIHSLPPSYKTWVLKQENVDPYLIKALSGGTITGRIDATGKRA